MLILKKWIENVAAIADDQDDTVWEWYGYCFCPVGAHKPRCRWRPVNQINEWINR